MKNYFIIAIVSAVGYTVIYLLMDFVFQNRHSVREYVAQAVVFGVIFGLFSYLDDKGWNSWEKIGNLFKCKKEDD